MGTSNESVASAYLKYNSNESDAQILGLSVDDHGNQNISFDDGPSLGKRLHFDSESSVDNEVSSLTGFMMDKRIKMENTSEDDTSSELLRRHSCDDLGDTSGMLLGTGATESIPSAPGDMVFTEEENSGDTACVLIHHMDIRDPLISLKKALEEAHGIDLEGYEFFLQDSTQLEGRKNLVEQCVQGCGTVQINIQLKIENDGTKKINILDVLKPSDSYLLATGNPAFSPDLPEEANHPSTPEETSTVDKNLTRWVVDHHFKVNQQRLYIPQDPMEWEIPHVRHWLLWAVRQFNLTGIKLADWKISGAMLCSLTLEDFKARVPYDPGDTFWTHLELLRRCKFVAVKQSTDEKAKENGEQSNKEKELDKNIMRSREKKGNAKKNQNATEITDPAGHVTGYRSVSGNNGQVQLWQFLLDLLTDKEHRSCIQWLGAEGEFKLIEPERVALLWGQRKNKPNMNYEKLSRALRYYYDGDMIAKVHGKRFVYKFVCDLKQLLGYSAFDLNRLVIEAEMRALNNVNDPIQHSIFGNRTQSVNL